MQRNFFILRVPEHWNRLPREVGEFPLETYKTRLDAFLCGSKDTRVIDVLETMEVPENSHKGIRASHCKNVAGSIAQMKCI